MKSKNLLWLLAFAFAPAVQAGTFTASSGTLNATIPDNDPNGYASSINVTPANGDGGAIQQVTVDVNISGGYNGDYYAYLIHTDPGNSTTAESVLLNRVGVGQGTPGSATYVFGYGNTGFNVNFSDSASANIHTYQSSSPTYNGSGQLTGTWAPDNSGTTSGSPSSAPLSNFIGQSTSSGSWTLFIADLSPGGVGTLVSWDVNITAIPEPVNMALGGLGVLALGAFAWRRFRGVKTA